MSSTKKFESKYPSKGKSRQAEQYLFENGNPKNDFASKNARRSLLEIITYILLVIIM